MRRLLKNDPSLLIGFKHIPACAGGREQNDVAGLSHGGGKLNGFSQCAFGVTLIVYRFYRS
jgi:hypothetical protein